MAYARRHLGPDEAADVVAETFLVAWRRWPEVPEPPIGWLLRTAAGVIKNRSRSTRRRDQLADKIALFNHAAAAVSDTADAVVRRDEALRRLAALSDEQREALLLVSWDGLSADEAAAVLNLRPATFRKRLSRARELLNRDEPPLPAVDHSAFVPTPLMSQEMS
ncbi:RNA polymerase sigma factor [Nocardioides sediminis]|uniref:RNA polymerase sigma factor n=1 Tax=Nocardioides sediminis TaxID=433648 RepID=UPI000D309718|nr:sigma-70 family RNA polymerase sigma factor [Nocardioides sediminis]